MMRSIKIAGISGVGKTTLIWAYAERHPATRTLSYGQFVAEHGETAASKWLECCDRLDGLVFMDEHLEFGHGDFGESYRRENTIGIVLLHAPMELLLGRRRRDESRTRDGSADKAATEYALSECRARKLSADLSIPLLRLEHLDLGVSLEKLERFVAGAG